ncbi:hypothetical protein COOONC_25409 [Cooperia oncophora]
MRFWEHNTCVTFRPRTNETEYVLYTSENPGCFSTVGRDTSQPVQAVNIGRGCQHVIRHNLARNRSLSRSLPSSTTLTDFADTYHQHCHERKMCN